MHARIATYQVTSGTATDVVAAARTGMLPIFQESPGFVRYGVVDLGDGTIVSLSLWESHAAAERAVSDAAAFVREQLAERITLRSNAVGDLAFFETVRSSL